MGDDDGNGERGQSAAPYLIITMIDPLKFKVQVGGSFPSLDYALGMLDQARREIEAQWRIQRAQLHLQQAADQQLANDLMRKR